MPESPPDRCPYTRPFPDEFQECGAYQPTRFIALDTGYHPMRSVWTCGHLDIGASPQRNRFYGRCRVGDAAARAEWVEVQQVERLATIRALGAELDPLMAEMATALWAAKARQLRSDDGSPEWQEATAELRHEARRLLTSLEAFMEEKAELFDSLGFPLEPFIKLFDDFIEAWVLQPNTEIPVIPDSALEAFPPDTRRFLKPDYGSDSAA